MSARKLFTEHEDYLTAGMPTLVAVGYVNARRRDGRGERADTRLAVTDVDTVIEVRRDLDYILGALLGGRR